MPRKGDEEDKASKELTVQNGLNFVLKLQNETSSCKGFGEYLIQACYCLGEDFSTMHRPGMMSALSSREPSEFLLDLVSSGFTEWHAVFPFFTWLFTVLGAGLIYDLNFIQ